MHSATKLQEQQLRSCPLASAGMALISDQQPAAEPGTCSQPTPHSALHPALPPAESAGATTDWAIDLAPRAESVVAPAPWPTLSELDSASTQLLGHNSHFTMTSNPLFTTDETIPPISAPAATTAQAASSPPPPPPPPAGALALTISPARSIRTIFLTVDQMLELHVGQFGLGQFFVLAVASSAFVPMGIMMLLMIFTSADPVEARKWRCTDAQDLACMQVRGVGRDAVSSCRVRLWVCCKGLLGKQWRCSYPQDLACIQVRGGPFA